MEITIQREGGALFSIETDFAFLDPDDRILYISAKNGIFLNRVEQNQISSVSVNGSDDHPLAAIANFVVEDGLCYKWL